MLRWRPSRSAARTTLPFSCSSVSGLQHQPRRFTARLDQAAEVSCIKSLSSAGSLTADNSLMNPSC